MISAKILADSITDGGSRLVTWEWTYPRMIHAEIMTHRVISRNAASSRAIPAAKLRRNILDAPATHVSWGANQKGMQASAEVADPAVALAWWLRGRDAMAAHHEEGEALGLHKQVVNRVIEPWMHITVISSMTSHANLFHLRRHADAEPNFRLLAALAWEAFNDNLPTYVEPGDWHLPMIDAEDRAVLSLDDLRKVSVGRCARVSYLTHDGRRDHAEDIALHDRLAATACNDETPMHASPLEHVAVAVGGRERHANFEGWRQYRALFAREAGPDTSTLCGRCGMWGDKHTRACSASQR